MDLREIKEFIKDGLKYIILIIAVLITIVYILSVQQVLGPSMQPTLNENDIILINKLKYRLFDIERFEIVVLDYNDSKYLIKRVIGIPGDNIEYNDNILYINGKVVEETFLKDIITDNFSLSDLGYTTIPEDMYLVLGDNRGNSMDGRDFGLINKSQIKGKVSFRIWPLTEIKFF